MSVAHEVADAARGPGSVLSAAPGRPRRLPTMPWQGQVCFVDLRRFGSVVAPGGVIEFVDLESPKGERMLGRLAS